MPIPEVATGSLYDANRLITFKGRVDVLIIFDQTGTELVRIDHWWAVEEPRKHFGDNFESGVLKIAEDEDDQGDLTTLVTGAHHFRYEINTADPITDIETMALSEVYHLSGLRKPGEGRSRIWKGKFSHEVFAQDFFKPGGH